MKDSRKERMTMKACDQRKEDDKRGERPEIVMSYLTRRVKNEESTHGLLFYSFYKACRVEHPWILLWEEFEKEKILGTIVIFSIYLFLHVQYCFTNWFIVNIQ